MTTTLLRKTPLHDRHLALGARMVDFAGWSMPVQYRSIVDEHTATRERAALFDVSHMGRLYFQGADAARFLDRMVTRKVHDLQPGQIRYGLLCNEGGTILDDVLVYRLAPDQHPDSHLMVVNAGNRDKVVSWLRNHLTGFGDVQMDDRTEATAMIAVQGPWVVPRMNELTGGALAPLRYYHGAIARLNGRSAIVSRTGYTGEDGCELIVSANDADPIWAACQEATSGEPAGLGARDTLRLEAAMPLYGHELSETINPFQADLAFAVNLEGREFIGHAALVRSKDDTTLPRRVGLALEGKRAAREHYPILASGRKIGEICSGSLSPSLGYPIAMAYLPNEYQQPGSSVDVDIRGSLVPARIVPLPFYKRKRA